MKTIGLIGGMSWESTVSYYKVINEFVKNSLGGHHSAKIVLYSVDFEEIVSLQKSGDWDKSGEILADAAKKLEQAGADFILICTNTMHKVVAHIEKAVSVPIIHIADVTAAAIKSENISTVALLGTKYTMTQDFYKQRLVDNGVNVLVPDQEGIEIVNDIIFNELCLGVISESSKAEYLKIIAELEARGAEGVILGCTEVGLLIGKDDTHLAIFDTAEIHAKTAAKIAITN